MKLSIDYFLMKISVNSRDCYLHAQQAFIGLYAGKKKPPSYTVKPNLFTMQLRMFYGLIVSLSPCTVS